MFSNKTNNFRIKVAQNSSEEMKLDFDSNIFFCVYLILFYFILSTCLYFNWIKIFYTLETDSPVIQSRIVIVRLSDWSLYKSSLIAGSIWPDSHFVWGIFPRGWGDVKAHFLPLIPPSQLVEVPIPGTKLDCKTYWPL